MDIEGIMLKEVSQTGKDKYHMISLECGSKEQNELTNKIEAGEEGWGTGLKGEGIKRYKLAVTK